MVESKDVNLNMVFQALADPTRRAILREIARRERSVGELAAPFDMSFAAVSKHVKVLERARLVQREKRGTFYYLRLNPKALKPANQWLSYYSQFWEEKLDSLKQFLEKDQP
jgi:DNA-binding transcriptional ArsR family regulator